MAGYGKPREPIDLIIAKGKKHLTKEEIERRKKTEVNVDAYKNVKPPNYLNKQQKKEFEEIAEKLSISALKFADLLPVRTTDYVFDIEKS